MTDRFVKYITCKLKQTTLTLTLTLTLPDSLPNVIDVTLAYVADVLFELHVTP